MKIEVPFKAKKVTAPMKSESAAPTKKKRGLKAATRPKKSGIKVTKDKITRMPKTKTSVVKKASRPEFGKDWEAHKLIKDFKHHNVQAERHHNHSDRLTDRIHKRDPEAARLHKEVRKHLGGNYGKYEIAQKAYDAHLKKHHPEDRKASNEHLKWAMRHRKMVPYPHYQYMFPKPRVKKMKVQSSSGPQKIKISLAAGEDRPQADDNVLALVPGAESHPAYADAVQACRDENIDPESSIGIARINKAIKEYDQADGGDAVDQTAPAGNRDNTEDATDERGMTQVDGTSLSASGQTVFGAITLMAGNAKKSMRWEGSGLQEVWKSITDFETKNGKVDQTYGNGWVYDGDTNLAESNFFIDGGKGEDSEFSGKAGFKKLYAFLKKNAS